MWCTIPSTILFDRDLAATLVCYFANPFLSSFFLPGNADMAGQQKACDLFAVLCATVQSSLLHPPRLQQ